MRLLARLALAALLPCALLLQPVVLPPATAGGCASLTRLVSQALAFGPGDTLYTSAGVFPPPQGQSSSSDASDHAFSQIYRSADPAHACFVPLASRPLPTLVENLLVPPHHPTWLLAAGGGALASTGVYLSQDGGRTWHDALRALHLSGVVPRSLQATPDGALLLSYYCQRTAPPAGLVACGSGVAISHDDGLSWRNLPAPPHTTLLDVAVLGAQHFFATGYQGTYLLLYPDTFTQAPLQALESDDAGQSWHPRTAPPDGEDTLWSTPWAPHVLLSNVTTQQPSLIISRSVDGRRWRTVQVRPFSRANDLPYTHGYAGLTTTHIVLRADFSALYRSGDNGATWQRVYPVSLPPPTHSGQQGVLALAVAADGRTAYFAGGLFDGTILYRTRDGGLSWQALS